MPVENHYFHCGQEWSDPDCDSFHNDRCPTCGAEIEPFKSDEDGSDEPVHHPLSDELFFELADQMTLAAKGLLDKLDARFDTALSDEIQALADGVRQSKARTSHALGDGDEPNPKGAVIAAANELSERLEVLLEALMEIREMRMDIYIGDPMSSTKLAFRNWGILQGIVADRPAD